ncbi:peptide MFS transporter [Rhizosaccharibacter radicis]|uniref:MFS transporter n=1 Tax=Rhizosaccharibacter radicis TaxID=2782605 RepID=A0ABT1VWL1_9PROT|nr:MFS transporter [Acetobacteraceae bacterium KSS12]
MSVTAATAGAVTARRRFGHPAALAVLAGTESWVSFSYYGMQSLLVLYMTHQLLLPGHLGRVWGIEPFRHVLALFYGAVSGQPLAAAVMGIYTALYFATPILGGLVADRLLGRTRTIVLGCVLMTLGHCLMTFEPSFLLALLCLVCGSGCAGNLKTQVGDLYRRDDPHRAEAFQLFVLVVQVAVIVAPLVCGALGEGYRWSLGFAAAGVGMLAGLVVYVAGIRLLPREPRLAERLGVMPEPAMTREEWGRVGLLLLLLPVLAIVAVGNMEIFNGYIVWGERFYSLRLWGHHLPVSWLLSLDGLIGTVTLGGSVLFWRWWARRRQEPDEIGKIVAASVLLALAPLVLALASMVATRRGGTVGLGWGVVFHLVNDVGFSNFYGIGIALFSRTAPRRLAGTMVNAFSLHLVMANLLVGWLAGLLATMPASRFWILHSLLIAVGTLLLAAARRPVRRRLGGETALVETKA